VIFRAVRGTHDVLPEEVSAWQYIEEKIREIMRLYNYEEIRTPTFEETALFTKGTGETTDIVGKEMYTFLDKGGRSLTLSPEGTPPVIRAYLEHHLGLKAPLTKLFYISRMFRQESPQAGRLRQHTQWGVEAIGSLDPVQDVEVIALLLQIYHSLGFKQFQLELNSIGCKKCRLRYKVKLKESLSSKMKRLCADCQVRFERNPLRILDCKNSQCQEEVKKLPSPLDNLCAECSTHFEKVKMGLNDLEISYILNPYLVRGLDYYTKTVFEVTSPLLGAQSSLGGGGRYDDLVSQLGGEPTPAVGFGAGMERLILALKKEGIQILRENKPHLFIAVLGEEAKRRGLKIINDLRKKGYSCEIDTLNRSLKAQMRAADKLNAKKVLILGEEELKKNKAILRDMETHEQKEVKLEELDPKTERIKALLE